MIKNNKLIKGRFKGELLDEVANEDPEYLEDLINNHELSYQESQAIIEALDQIDYQYTITKDI